MVSYRNSHKDEIYEQHLTLPMNFFHIDSFETFQYQSSEFLTTISKGIDDYLVVALAWGLSQIL